MDVTQNKNIEEKDSLQHFEVLQELGDCHTSVGDFLQAQNYYEKAATLGPDEAGPYLGLGVIALQKNLLEDALIAFKVACRLDPKCSKAYAGLAMIAQQKADYKQAFSLYLKCLEIDGNNLTALLGLFQVSCQMGSFDKVIYYLDVYLNMHPADTSVMFTLAALYMKENKLQASHKLLTDILILDPQNKDARDLLEEVEHNLAQTEQIELKI